ncbi:hypothetical protein TcCL_ESM02458 [Trypanosoma cruzi]|nr:hypothetical protein TcCL_ESM02458 [Trypanosoma cruzi]
MLRPIRLFPVMLCKPSRCAASATWFGGADDSNSIMGVVKGLFICFCGIACINLWSRGNALGKVNTENDVYIPVAALRKRARDPRTDGFVDGFSEAEEAQNTEGRRS